MSEVFILDTNIPKDINSNITWDSVDCIIAVHQDPKAVSVLKVDSVRQYYERKKAERKHYYDKAMRLYNSLNQKSKTYNYDVSIYNLMAKRIELYDLEISDIEKICGGKEDD